MVCIDVLITHHSSPISAIVDEVAPNGPGRAMTLVKKPSKWYAD